jgi:hypothetical protein
MKFKDIILEWLITENKEEIYKKYYSDINRDTFIRIIQGDPKSSVINDVINNIGKHSKLLLDMYKRGSLKLEDLPKANEYLTLVYQHNMPVDHKKVLTIPDLYNLVKDKIAKVQTSLVELIKLLETSEYSVKHNGDAWFIVQPKTEKAAAYLGVNTEWCTTWGKYCLNPDYKDRTPHFGTYSPQGPLYIIVNKENESDKYQLHFPSNQLKNPADSEISNRPNFFNERLEVKKYFFPTIYESNPSKDDIKRDLPRAKKFLDKADTTILLDGFVAYFGEVNPFVKALYDENYTALSEFLTDESIKDFSIYKGYFNIELANLPSSVDSYQDSISNLRISADNAHNNAWENESYQYNQEEGEETIGGYLSTYYEKNKEDLISTFGNACKTYEMFYGLFGKGIFDDEKIKDSYLDEYSNGTGASEAAAFNTMADEFEECLEVERGWSDNEIKFPIEKVIEFLLEKDVLSIDNLDSFIDDYIYHYDLPTEAYLDYPEYDYVYPTQEFMDGVFNEYFETIADKFNSALELNPEYGKECLTAKNKIADVVSKHFNQNGEFENHFVKIKLENSWIKTLDCDKGIEVVLTNKKTNETHKGYMQIDSVINYMNIEPLLENMSFSKILFEMKKGKN